MNPNQVLNNRATTTTATAIDGTASTADEAHDTPADNRAAITATTPLPTINSSTYGTQKQEVHDGPADKRAAITATTPLPTINSSTYGTQKQEVHDGPADNRTAITAITPETTFTNHPTYITLQQQQEAHDGPVTTAGNQGRNNSASTTTTN
ncbi:hypothetical protein CHS0354_042927 [Potamilus streckersoni]|uniref:Uncharacterized protein n=1 Tax=Potamilus streckersoni TaxID=2493646 RepID=A0AAE0W8A6_9BIVA|nr:hypothetical protein CHS0354_042927 [Potamilus streckersoni]